MIEHAWHTTNDEDRAPGMSLWQPQNHVDKHSSLSHQVVCFFSYLSLRAPRSLMRQKTTCYIGIKGLPHWNCSDSWSLTNGWHVKRVGEIEKKNFCCIGSAIFITSWVVVQHGHNHINNLPKNLSMIAGYSAPINCHPPHCRRPYDGIDVSLSLVSHHL